MSAQWSAVSELNIKRLQENRYPGRGIVIGLTPDRTRLMQVYWIMGRSENSRNRIFVREANGFVRTEARDPEKLSDPSLIIYYPVKQAGQAHIVTNGDQTDTIVEALSRGGSFEDALSLRTFEPDPPNYTPRISGLVVLNEEHCTYKLSILKTNMSDPSQTQRQFFHYEQAAAGYGHMIHTYEGDGDPLPSFTGEPVLVPLYDDVDRVARFYWDLLDPNNKIALLVKTIEVCSGQSEMRILNKE